MYLRRCYRNKSGKRHAYWALVEAYRTARGPRQRVVAYLGETDAQGRLGVTHAAEARDGQQLRLFEQAQPEWVEVDVNGLRIEQVRSFGGPWLGLERTRHAERGAVERQIGRLLGQNSRAAGLFDVRVEPTAAGLRLKWSKREDWRQWSQLSEGCYLLRSNVTDWSAEELWQAYIQLTDAEAAFRIHQSDLGLRPVWHPKEERVRAHILVCFLAYVLWKTLGQWCQRAGLGSEPRKVLDELQQLKVVDAVLPTRRGTEIRKRCVARPTAHQALLLDRLRLSLPRQLKVLPDLRSFEAL
jgi:hypothetical protein